MNKLVVFSLPAWVVALLMLAGCGATYHRAQYVSTIKEPPKAVDAAAVTTRIAENFDSEVHALYAKGYELIGYAQFSGPLQPQFAQVNARWAAEHHGATYVLLAQPSQRALNQYFYLTTFWRPVRQERFILGAYYDDAPAEMLGLVGCEQNMALVRAVVPGTPAERMGLKAGDLITFFDDERIEDARMLDELLLRKAGQDAEIKFLRDEKGLVARGRLGAGEQQSRPAALDRGVGVGLNLTQGALSDELSASLGRREGVFVGGVRYGSTACASDLRSGDLITAVDGEAIADIKDARARLEKPGASKVTVSVLNAGLKENVTLDRTPAFLARLEALRRLDIAEAGYDRPWTRSEGADYSWAALVSLTAQGIGAGHQNYLKQREQERIAQVAAYNEMQRYRAPPAAVAPDPRLTSARRQATRNSGAPPGYYYSRRQNGLVPIQQLSQRPVTSNFDEFLKNYKISDPLKAFLGQVGYANYGMSQAAKTWTKHKNYHDNNDYSYQGDTKTQDAGRR